MGINRYLTTIKLITLLMATAMSFSAASFDEIDESVIFAAVAQGHHNDNNSGCNSINNPQLTIYPGSRISGTNGDDLSYCSINTNNGLPTDSCDTATGGDRLCTITGASIRGLKMNGNQAFESSDGSAGSIGFCNSGDQISLGDNGDTQFNSLSLFSDCTVTFSSDNDEYRFNAIRAGSGSILKFPEGDYWINSLQLDAPSKIETTGRVRIFIGTSSQINGGTINSLAEAGVQVIAYNNLTLNNQNVNGTSIPATINANVYSDERITINSGAINGRVTSKYLVMNSDGQINEPVEPVIPFHIQYGKATSTSVAFDDAFPAGVTPLVFIMPTISETNPLSTDGPQSAFLSNISETGFTWARQEPPGNIVSSADMPEVHWVAVTPGTHDLSNGTQLIAGSVEYDLALIGANNNYTSVTMDASQDVLLNQMQTSNNDCWLTSTSQFNNTGIQLAMDTSEVRNNSAECQPAGLSNGNLQNETIAYLTVASGSGALILNGEDLNYHFGNSQTFFNSNSIRDVEYQCSVTTSLTGFTDVPILVAGKTNRRGGDGGWLRRCQLTNDLVSMVVDEDTYQDNDRRHIWENYSFFALERTEPVSQCFTDDFNRTSLGTDWVAASSSGSFTPSIVSNKLRLTQAAGNQATSTTYQRLFPAADNLIEIEFDHSAYDGNGADGIAMVFSDASITPQPGAAGGPLGYGYKPGVDGFAGGWLGIGIDEYGNFSAEGGDNNIGRRQQSVSIRGSGSGTSGYPYLRGTCNNGTTNTTGDCLTPPVDNNENDNHRYRIVIDSRVSGQSLVSVSRDTGSGFVEIVPQFDILSFASQAAVPDDFILSITGSTGGSTNVHEIDDIEFCALDSSPVGVVIDHFEFTHTGSALTCNAEPMTLTACANADCTQTVPDFVTATLSPATIATGGGWVGGNVVSFSGGSTNLSLRNNTAGSVTVDVTGSTPGAKPFSTTLCSVAGSTPTAEQCTFNFADSGFIFTVPDKLANKPSGAISISAVKKDTETLECTPQFENVTKSVGFWSDYVNPSSVISASSVSVTGTGAATDIGTSIGARTPIALQFDASGIAEFEVNYPDAGAIQLNAQYDGTGEEDGLVMVGADPFVSFPAGLCVKPVDANASCTAGDSSCDVYIKAGEDFDLTVQAMAWESDSDTDYCDNLTTPNYVHAGIVLGSNLVAPNPGEAGTLGLGNYDHVAVINSQNTITQSISEVGVFEFTAKAPSEYLGSTFYDIPQASSGNIGRFIPDRFVVSSVSVLPACGIFNYMDQPFSMAMNITAFNIGSEVTKNYQDAFAYATGILVGENSDDGDDKRNRMSALPVSASSWVAGVATVDSSYMASLSRTTAPSQDGPFEDFDIGLIVVDNDGDNSFVSDPDMNATTSGTCGSNCDAKLLSNQRFRHGRVVMDNTYGAENDMLQMPTRAEYWNGLAWVTNTDDSCSVVTPALASQVDDLSLGYKFEPSLTTGQLIDRTGQTGSFSNGEFTLLWNAIITGSAADYRGQVTAPLIVPEWLQWYWNWENASSTTLYDPRASAYFGRYRGHDRIIYWREKR
ncbi:MSHA biogenesis protein MshQ [Shewanella sp. 10N.286.51.B7]|nr:MSHA biogenesis protein MshQ [Shewanella sp. 10N.286.51.B7]